MKQLLIAVLISSTLLAASCTDDSTDAGSVPIDSTNLNGTAPASYDAQNPDGADYPRYQGRWDTGAAANTTTEADSNTDRIAH